MRQHWGRDKVMALRSNKIPSRPKSETCCHLWGLWRGRGMMHGAECMSYSRTIWDVYYMRLISPQTVTSMDADLLQGGWYTARYASTQARLCSGWNTNHYEHLGISVGSRSRTFACWHQVYKATFCWDRMQACDYFTHSMLLWASWCTFARIQSMLEDGNVGKFAESSFTISVSIWNEE